MPAIVSVPDRATPPGSVPGKYKLSTGLPETANDTTPLSRPELPEIIFRNESLLRAVQEQPAACDATVTVPWPGAEVNENVEGVTENAQVTRFSTMSTRWSDVSGTVNVADS
jgi:hypothetical protein